MFLSFPSVFLSELKMRLKPLSPVCANVSVDVWKDKRAGRDDDDEKRRCKLEIMVIFSHFLSFSRSSRESREGNMIYAHDALVSFFAPSSSWSSVAVSEIIISILYRCRPSSFSYTIVVFSFLDRKWESRIFFNYSSWVTSNEPHLNRPLLAFFVRWWREFVSLTYHINLCTERRCSHSSLSSNHGPHTLFVCMEWIICMKLQSLLVPSLSYSY